MLEVVMMDCICEYIIADCLVVVKVMG